MLSKVTIDRFAEFCSGSKVVELSDNDKKAVVAGRNILEELEKSGKVYGVNTGVGPFFGTSIADGNMSDVQRRLLLGHAVGTGEMLSMEEVRGMMFLLINMLSKGFSGIHLETIEALIELYNRDIIPAVPSKGSLGASGDLAPLAHMALVLIGEGRIMLSNNSSVPTESGWVHGKYIRPVELRSGEALMLINGTHMMTSVLGLTVRRAEILAKTADIIGVVALLALGGNRQAFSDIIHNLRPHKGQQDTADNVLRMLNDCEESSTPYLQDSYSLRCIPQVHGVVKETVTNCKDTVEIEMNSVTGNPIFHNGNVFNGGNFHGHPLALAANFLSIALTTLGGISERRTYRILDPALSGGLPSYLALYQEMGDCGLMMPQCTAAALVSENKTLSSPASVDSIPTAGGQEDYVSMGALACRNAREVCTNTERVLAIELLCAFRAIELSREFKSNYPDFLWALRGIMQKSATYQYLDKDIELVATAIASGEVLEKVEEAIGDVLYI